VAEMSLLLTVSRISNTMYSSREREHCAEGVEAQSNVTRLKQQRALYFTNSPFIRRTPHLPASGRLPQRGVRSIRGEVVSTYSREWQGCNPGIHPLTLKELAL
jgi:hypothetical protein